MTIIQKKSKYKQLQPDTNNQQEDFGALYHCDSCSKDISNLVRIRCAECPDFDLCVECFSTGVQLKNHKSAHKYRVMDVLDFPLFEDNWCADEELALIEGLEMFGIGNWEQIAEHIASSKSKEECAAHYHRVYIDSPDWPMPMLPKSFDMNTSRRSQKPPKEDVVKKVFIKVNRPPSSAPANHEIQGFMPGRGEFDVEHENEAESQVREMVFEENEPEDEILFKTTILDIYNKVLDRRLDRKAFIFSRNLTDFKKIQQQEKRRTREAREMYTKARAFARCITQSDFELFTAGLNQQATLTARIFQLQEFRKAGLQSLKDVPEYERNKRDRERELKNSTTRDSYVTAHAERNVSSRYSTSSLNIKMKNESRASTPKSAASPTTFTEPMNIDSAPMIVRKPPAALNISGSEGHDLLSEQEQQLCSQLRILPRAYLIIKETLLSEHARQGGNLKKRAARGLVRIDVNKTGKVWDFFVSKGWL